MAETDEEFADKIDAHLKARQETSDRQLDLVRSNVKLSMMQITDPATKRSLETMLDYIDEIRRNT